MGHADSRRLILVLAIAALASCASAANYTVGDTFGWRRPTSLDFYARWAAQYTFKINDTLIFDNKGTNADVQLRTQAEYETCDTSDPTRSSTYSKLPLAARLPEAGVYFVISSNPGDCAAGLKVTVTVMDASSGGGAPGPSPPPSPPLSAPPPSLTPPAPVPELNIFYVGGISYGWQRPPAGQLSYYNDWAASVSPLYNDTDALGFLYDSTIHNVVQVPKSGYDTCDASAALITFDTGNETLVVGAAGFFYFISGGPGDCLAGMRFGIQYVLGSRPATPSVTPPSSPPLTPPATPDVSPPSSPPLTPPSPPLAPPTSPPVTPPASPPLTPPVTPPASPLTPPVTPPASPPLTPPASPPATPPATPPASPPPTLPASPPATPPSPALGSGILTPPGVASPPLLRAPPISFPNVPPIRVQAPPPPRLGAAVSVDNRAGVTALVLGLSLLLLNI